jgi:hypothetical protein
MNGRKRNSVDNRKPSKSKSIPHIIGVLKTLRRKMPSKTQFSSHISREGLLDGGVGLVLWFIDDKAIRNESGRWEFYLGCRFGEMLCPRRKGEKIITKYLQEAGIIEVVRRGVAGLCNTYYALKDEWVRILPSNFKLNEWQRERLANAFLWARNEQYKRRPFLAWIDETLRRTIIPESTELREALKNPKTLQSARATMDFLRGYLPFEEHSITEAKYCGTIYTPIASMPKEIVKTLLIDGEEIVQLDITAAHPSTLPCVMIEAEKKYGVAGAIQEAARLRDDLESDCHYDSIGNEVGLSRKEAKQKLLAAFNGEDEHTYNDATFKAFARRFPIAKQVISMIRDGDRKRLNKKMASTLSKAIDKTIQTCWEYRIPCFPRTDEIVCRKRDAEFVREVLAAYFFDETSVNARVGKKRVSFIPSEEDVWMQFSIRYKFEKSINSQIKKIEDDLPLWNCVKMIQLSQTVQKQSQIQN